MTRPTPSPTIATEAAHPARLSYCRSVHKPRRPDAAFVFWCEKRRERICEFWHPPSPSWWSAREIEDVRPVSIAIRWGSPCAARTNTPWSWKQATRPSTSPRFPALRRMDTRCSASLLRTWTGRFGRSPGRALRFCDSLIFRMTRWAFCRCRAGKGGWRGSRIRMATFSASRTLGEMTGSRTRLFPLRFLGPLAVNPADHPNASICFHPRELHGRLLRRLRRPS